MKYILTIALLVSTLTAPALAAPQTSKQKGIMAYNARDYAGAASSLQQATSANPKDGMAHYYLALTYQAMGRRSDAEREYKWNYENGTDADLKQKSWVGLSNLSRSMRSTATPATAQAAQVAAGYSSSPYSSRVEKMKGFKREVNFVAGCPNHR